MSCGWKSSPDPPLHHPWWLEWGVCGDTLWLVFNKCDVLLYDHTAPLHCPKDFAPDIFLFVQMQLCKSKLCCHDHLGEKKENNTCLVVLWFYCHILQHLTCLGKPVAIAWCSSCDLSQHYAIWLWRRTSTPWWSVVIADAFPSWKISKLPKRLLL